MSPLAAAAVLLLSSTAFAWSSYEYRNSDGEYRYGIRDGSSKLQLGLGKRKQADKAAKKMNKANKVDEAAAEEEAK
ncbi:MAG: hypothetical protein ACRBN8_34385 [Nannocystales bacterium]